METRDDLFVVVRRGDPADAENAVDVVVIDDEQLVRTFGSLFAKRLGGRAATPPPPAAPAPGARRQQPGRRRDLKGGRRRGCRVPAAAMNTTCRRYPRRPGP